MSQYCDGFMDMWEGPDGFDFAEDVEDQYAIWQGLRGPAGPQGEPGRGLTISGITEDISGLPATAGEGNVWLVGTAPPYTAYIFLGGEWTSLGEVAVGPAGPPGPQGEAGPQGPQGETGPAGADGLTTSVNGINQVDGNVTLTASDIAATDDRSIQAHLTAVESNVSELLTFEALHLTGSISNTAMYLTGSRITADMRVLECSFGTPANVTTDLTWTTAAGQITFSGTLSAATTIDLILGKTN